MCHGDNNNGIINVLNQAKIIKKYDVDLILLQEVDICTLRSKFKNELDEFNKIIGFEYSSFGTNITYKEGWYGNAILSKYPIVSSENFLNSVADYSKEVKGILHSKIKVTEKDTIKYIDAFNTHLSVYEKERIIHTESFVNMIERNGILGNMIFAGDLNLGVFKIGEHKYDVEKCESYKELENLKKILKCPEFNVDTWPTGNPIGDIDKILYNGDIELTEIKRLDVQISDHYPVYAEFNI
jgi:endonuclease/exonuclease/phosphatase family metal-dependent hydrolase